MAHRKGFHVKTSFAFVVATLAVALQRAGASPALLVLTIWAKRAGQALLLQFGILAFYELIKVSKRAGVATGSFIDGKFDTFQVIV